MKPTFHLIAGPNGAGKTTFYEQYLRPRTGAPFMNPDLLAREVLGHWSRSPEGAALGKDLASARRASLIAAGQSLAMESTFSHPSKLELIEVVIAAGYRLDVIDRPFSRSPPGRMRQGHLLQCDEIATD